MISIEKINKKKIKIMILVDEEDILILYKDFLSGIGHEVATRYLNVGDMIKEIKSNI